MRRDGFKPGDVVALHEIRPAALVLASDGRTDETWVLRTAIEPLTNGDFALLPLGEMHWTMSEHPKSRLVWP